MAAKIPGIGKFPTSGGKMKSFELLLYMKSLVLQAIRHSANAFHLDLADHPNPNLNQTNPLGVHVHLVVHLADHPNPNLNQTNPLGQNHLVASIVVLIY